MTATESRRFIAAMQVTLDGYSLDSDGNADWVDSWSDSLQLLPTVDAFVLGAGMFSQYEAFWAAVSEDPSAVAEWLGRAPYPREVEYARIAAQTPHLVLSTTLRDTSWPTAQIVRDIDALRAYKAQPGGPVYIVGGARLVRSLIDEDLVDELILSMHPVIAGTGEPLLSGVAARHDLELIDSARGTNGLVHLTYRIPTTRHDHAR